VFSQMKAIPIPINDDRDEAATHRSDETPVAASSAAWGWLHAR
jgi:hypothetical protein